VWRQEGDLVALIFPPASFFVRLLITLLAVSKIDRDYIEDKFPSVAFSKFKKTRYDLLVPSRAASALVLFVKGEEEERERDILSLNTIAYLIFEYGGLELGQPVFLAFLFAMNMSSLHGTPL
jgi:hypothetical protein